MYMYIHLHVHYTCTCTFVCDYSIAECMCTSIILQHQAPMQSIIKLCNVQFIDPYMHAFCVFCNMYNLHVHVHVHVCIMYSKVEQIVQDSLK